MEDNRHTKIWAGHVKVIRHFLISQFSLTNPSGSYSKPYCHNTNLSVHLHRLTAWAAQHQYWSFLWQRGHEPLSSQAENELLNRSASIDDSAPFTCTLKCMYLTAPESTDTALCITPIVQQNRLGFWSVFNYFCWNSGRADDKEMQPNGTLTFLKMQRVTGSCHPKAKLRWEARCCG